MGQKQHIGLNPEGRPSLIRTMQLDWGARAPSRAADGKLELQTRRAASRPALAVRIGRVESPPVSEQLRAVAGARARREAMHRPSSSNFPRPTREARVLPNKIHFMVPA